MKRDAVIRISREVWKRAMTFALGADRELREVVGAALEEYVARESGVELGEKEKHV